MKLPNGFGTVYKMSGNRRRPWVVKKSINGKQRVLGYFTSFDDGMSFLLAYNRDSLPGYELTFAQIFERWKDQKFPFISESSRKAYLISFRYCITLHSVAFSSIKFADLQKVIKSIKAGHATQAKVKLLMGQLYDYAIKYDLAKTDCSRFVVITPHMLVHKKRPFTTREINRLWRSLDVPGTTDVLILIYTGMRVGEFLSLKRTDVKVRQKALVIRKSKTAAGVRTIPVARKIWPLVEPGWLSRIFARPVLTMRSAASGIKPWPRLRCTIRHMSAATPARRF